MGPTDLYTLFSDTLFYIAKTKKSNGAISGCVCQFFPKWQA